MLVIGLTAYIVYDKVLIENNNGQEFDNGNNNQNDINNENDMLMIMMIM